MSDKLDVTRIVEMLGQGMTEADVAYKLNTTVWAVRMALQEAGVKRPSQSRPRASKRPLDDARLLELAKTHSLRQMADEFKCSISKVHSRMVVLGIKRRSLSESVRLAISNRRAASAEGANV